MRALLAVAVYAALTVCGYAQNGAPRQIKAADELTLRIGEVRLFDATKDIESFIVTSDEVVKALAVETNRTFTLRGIGPGEALVTINYADGSKYRVNVLVGGRTVRIYGNERRARTAGYYFCTNIECTRFRAAEDKRTPTSESVSVTGRDEDGNSVTTIKTY